MPRAIFSKVKIEKTMPICVDGIPRKRFQPEMREVRRIIPPTKRAKERESDRKLLPINCKKVSLVVLFSRTVAASTEISYP